MHRVRQIALAGLLFASLLSAQSSSGFQQIPGNLKQLSVGADGTVWGVDAYDQIFRWNAQNSSWVNIPGSLSQIAVGSTSVVYGVNSQGQVYRWSGDSEWFSGSWVQLPVSRTGRGGVGDVTVTGTLDQVVAGADGTVFALDNQQNLYQYYPQYQTLSWQDPYPGGFKYASVSVGFDGAVWVIYSPGTEPSAAIAEMGLTYSKFAQILTQISAGADGDVWGLNGTSVYHFNRLTRNWDSISGSLKQISVGSGANVWGLDSSGAIYRFDNQMQSWTNVPGNLAQISAAQNGSVWGLDSSGNIFEYTQPVQPTGTFHLVPGSLAQISVAPDGNVWGVDAADQIFTFNPLTQAWTEIPGALAYVTVNGSGDVWGLNAGGQIYSFNISTQSWQQIPGELQQIAQDQYDAGVRGINSAQQIYQFNTGTQRFDWIPGALTQIAPSWGVNNQDQIYVLVFGRNQFVWSEAPGSLSQIAVGSSVWGFNYQGTIYRLNSSAATLCFSGSCPANSWDFIAAGLTPAMISTGSDGATWMVDHSGHVLRYDLPSQKFVQAGSGMSSIAVGSDGAVWALDSAGRIYQYW